MKRKISNERAVMLILVALTAAGITASCIVSDEAFLKFIPLYVSLSVMLFQSEAKRIALLIGGINSILYAIVDYSYGLYASAVSDIVFSCLLQFLAFILWTKRYGDAEKNIESIKGNTRLYS